MRSLMYLTIMLAIVLLAVAPCFAENALDKLGRGLINGATGWVEYPKQIVEVSKEHNVAVGLSYGQVKGVAMALQRTGLGSYDTGSFFLPRYDSPTLDPKTLLE
ncbi:exosortase system-associated protein, TIGR04073 family [Candidatus Omnitrophota bacterium]